MTRLSLTQCKCDGNLLKKWLIYNPLIVSLSAVACDDLTGFQLPEKHYEFVDLTGTKIDSDCFSLNPTVTKLVVTSCYRLNDDFLEYCARSPIVTLNISLNVQLNAFHHLFGHKTLRTLMMRGIRHLNADIVRTLLSSNQLQGMLDPLGKWRYR